MFRVRCTPVRFLLERQVTNEQLWLGRRVKIVDGTGLSMPAGLSSLLWHRNTSKISDFRFGVLCVHTEAIL